MSSSEENDSDELTLTPPEIQEAASENLLPPRSKVQYLKCYENFLQWRNDRKFKSLSENVFLDYFNELAKKLKPPTLWVTYSMLKCTVLMKHDVNLKLYANLTSMLKRQSDGYRCQKSRVFTSSNVNKFLFEAPDSVYLDIKVILIFGIFGACRCQEITNITIKDVGIYDGVIIVTVRDSKTKIIRTFVIRDEPAEIVQKYIALRPTDAKSDRFFLYYKNNKCTKQAIGRHKIATMPKAIAVYLNLPNPEYYTGYCFRRTSATLLANTSANSITLKRHGGWNSDRVAESYIEVPIENESSITRKINENNEEYAKVVLKKKESSKESATATSSSGAPEEGPQTDLLEKHVGFSCNSCRGAILGFRYSCVECVNFDMCARCEAMREHDHHYVLRVPQPRPEAEFNAMMADVRAALAGRSQMSQSQYEPEVKHEPQSDDEDLKPVDPLTVDQLAQPAAVTSSAPAMTSSALELLLTPSVVDQSTAAASNIVISQPMMAEFKAMMADVRAALASRPQMSQPQCVIEIKDEPQSDDESLTVDPRAQPAAMTSSAPAMTSSAPGMTSSAPGLLPSNIMISQPIKVTSPLATTLHKPITKQISLHKPPNRAQTLQKHRSGKKVTADKRKTSELGDKTKSSAIPFKMPKPELQKTDSGDTGDPHAGTGSTKHGGDYNVFTMQYKGDGDSGVS